MSGHSPSFKVAPDGGKPVLRVIGWISSACGVVAAACIVASVLITVQMIWVRFVMGKSTIWQTEAVIYLMIAATMIGLPYVQRLRGHVNVDLVPMLLPMGLRRVFAAVTLAAAMIVVGVMLWYGFDLWHVAWQRNWKSETVWGVQLWIPYIVMPVGFGLYLVQLAADMYVLLAGIEKPFGLDEHPALRALAEDE